MFKRFDVFAKSDPFCRNTVDEIVKEDFRYFDKDGFELNIAEQKFYSAMGYPIHNRILNHCCWQETWFELESKTQGLLLDHCMLLHRCGYSGNAKDQLEQLSESIPEAKLLLQIKPKWGFDFDLNGIAPDGTIFEILHVEFDTRNYDHFCNRVIMFDYTIRHTNWHRVRDDVWSKREEWQDLKGFDQNHWKAKFVLGWDRAESIEKSIK